MNANDCSQQNKNARVFDERRGAHLLAPGDAIRCRGTVWDVVGVYLHSDRRHSTIGLMIPNDDARHELLVPLIIVETGCEIFLRAEGPASR